VADSMASYGSLKRAVTDAVIAELEPLRTRHDDLLNDPAELSALLSLGAEKALLQSSAVLARAKDAVGL
jgi:tryptophanyl-tRNA synthetase